MIEVAMKFLLPGSGSTRESYFFNAPVGSPSQFEQQAYAVTDARHKCNSPIVRLHSISVSDTEIPNKSINLRGIDGRPGGLAGHPQDVSDLSVRMDMLDSRLEVRDIHFLHGVPDDQISYQGATQVVGPDLSTALNNFRAALLLYSPVISGRVRSGSSQAPKQRINTVAIEAGTGRLLFNVPGHSYDGGNQVYIKKVAFNSDFSFSGANGKPVWHSQSNAGVRKLNSRHIVIPTSAAANPFVDWFAIQLFSEETGNLQYRGGGTVQVHQVTFLPVTFIIFQNAVTRAVGVGPVRPRGRARATKKGLY